MRSLIEKAAVLHEALPYIRRFQGETFVIKYGGHAMTDAALRESFAKDLVLLKYVGIHPVVVHGGGPQIDEELKRFGIESQRVEGLRITDDATMHVVEMVLGGTINMEICALIGRHGGRAVGLSGVDDRLLVGERLPKVQTRSGALVDTGRVGQIRSVRPEVIESLVKAGMIPVISPLAIDEDGKSLNLNADTAAGAIAAALQASKLLLMTDTPGVRGADGELIQSLDDQESARLRKAGVIDGGMIPKIECALEALAGGVRKCHILDGREQHAILLEIFTDAGIGTEIVRRAARDNA